MGELGCESGWAEREPAGAGVAMGWACCVSVWAEEKQAGAGFWEGRGDRGPVSADWVGPRFSCGMGCL